MGSSSTKSSCEDTSTAATAPTGVEAAPLVRTTHPSFPLSSPPRGSGGGGVGGVGPAIHLLRVAVVGYSWRFISEPAWVDRLRTSPRCHGSSQPFNAEGVSPLVGRMYDYIPGGFEGPTMTYESFKLPSPVPGDNDYVLVWDYCLDEMQGRVTRLLKLPTTEPNANTYLSKIDTLNHEAFIFWYEQGNSKSWAFLKNTLQCTILRQRQTDTVRNEHKFSYGDISIIDEGYEDACHVSISKVPLIIACIRCANVTDDDTYTCSKPKVTSVENEAMKCAASLDCPFFKVDIADKAQVTACFQALFSEAKRLGFTKSGTLADHHVWWEIE
ncbi:hypothetical protein Pelo_16299 [Pelomyxa schiedti]|nr:hypothetical protein Pelo_16299 [Pelomyxa schiedti]